MFVVSNWGLYPRILKRKLYLFQFNLLAMQRAFSLWGASVGSFYSFWLLGRHGWRRYSSTSNWFVKVLIVFLVYSVSLSDYSAYMYSWFSNPVLSDKGYLGFTVFC